MSTSGPQPVVAQTSSTKLALACPEILHTIGEWILVSEWKRLSPPSRIFRPLTMLSCCLVSKYWREVLTPLLWYVDDMQLGVRIPRTLFATYYQHVRIFRIFDLWDPLEPVEPPPYTRLRRLIMFVGDKYEVLAKRLISTNRNLVALEMVDPPFFEQMDGSQSESDDEYGNSRGTDDDTGDNDDTVWDPTNPLGHLKSLQSLSVGKGRMEGTELYSLLRGVAHESLTSLDLRVFDGSFDLQDLMFGSLTQLHLSLAETIQPMLYEIIGRCPNLTHLELRGYFGDDPSVGYHFEQIAHLLRGTRPKETTTSQSKEGGFAPRQRSGPRLAVLQLTFEYEVDSDKYLELVLACNNTLDRQQRRWVYLDTLRELHLSLRLIDEKARDAIGMHSSGLEVLKIEIIDCQCDDRAESMKLDSQGLRKLLRACPRLKELEYWGVGGNVDISVMMNHLMEDYGAAGNDDGGHDDNTQHQLEGSTIEEWCYPELESLTLGSDMPERTETVEESERLFSDESEDEDGMNGYHSFGTWVMSSFKRVPTVQDGTAFLLDISRDNIELFEDVIEEIGRSREGEERIKRFLRCIAPSRKLKRLQLAQLQLKKRSVNKPRDFGCCAVVLPKK